MDTHFFYTLPIIATFLALATLLERRRLQRSQKKTRQEVIPLAKFAERLFEKEFSSANSETRVAEALHLVLTKFQAGMVVLRYQNRGSNRTLMRIGQAGKKGSISDVEVEQRKLTEQASLFCHSLNEQRQELNLDFAGSGPWKDHPARAEHGWESYYGLRKNLESGGFLTLGIYSSSPRIERVSAADKIFLQNLVSWIDTVLQRDVEYFLREESGKTASATMAKQEIPLEN